MYDYDTVIIGGGPAGTACAIKLARHSKKVAIIEKDAIGGVCLNRGCIPSKTYLYAVELLENIKKASRHGIEVDAPKISWEKINQRKELNIKMLGAGLTKTLQEAGVEIIHGEAMLSGKHEITILGTKKTLSAEHIVVASGSKSLFLPNIIHGENVISSTDILHLKKIPQTLAIIGGGVTGVEMASIFAGFGTKVIMIERQKTILPAQDMEISAFLKKSLEKKGCTIYTNTDVIEAKDKNDSAEIIYQTQEGKKETLITEKVLVVIGRKVRYDIDIFEKIGIKNDGKKVELNENFQTSISNMYVIGDAAFRQLIAYGSEREGECVAAHILGESKKIHYENIPLTIFSHPEIGQIGLTEEEAKKQGIDYALKRSQYAANAKAIIESEREGMVKIIIERKSQKILGVHIIGTHATELIHQAIIPVVQKMTVKNWLELVWSHPVLSEILKTALETSTKEPLKNYAT